MSEYRELFEKKYSKGKMDYAEEMDFKFMANAPEQYGVEDEMLEYLKNNPDATVVELFDQFDKIAPEGLADGDDGADLLEAD